MNCLQLLMQLIIFLMCLFMLGCPSPESDARYSDPATAPAVPITSGMDTTERLLIEELNRHREIQWSVDVEERHRILTLLTIYKQRGRVSVSLDEVEAIEEDD